MTRLIKNTDHFREVLAEALDGKYASQALLKEAITTDDIPYFMRQVVNAELEEQYPLAEPVYRTFTTDFELNDFRPGGLYELIADSSMLRRENGGETRQVGLPRIPELTPYPTFEYRESEKWFTTHKNGARIHFSFEAFINDEWDQIASLPAEMVRLAVDTEEALAHLQLVGPNGINSANFNAANGNVLQARTTATLGDVTGAETNVPANAPLSLDALFAALAQIKEQRHNGRAVRVPRFVLLVPPALTQYANVLVNAAVVRQTVGGREFEISNPLPAQIRVVESEFLAELNGDDDTADTTWFLLPEGGRTGNGRRTIIETFLRGRRTPEMRVSGNTGRYIGGGDVPYTEGSFDNDDAEVRIRHIVGSGFVNPDGTIASDGSGTEGN